MGINSTYPTGAPTGNVYLDSLIWGGSWADGPHTTTTVTWTTGSGSLYYSGSRLWTNTWLDYEVKALESAFQQWDNVCNVNFTYVASCAQANLVEFNVDAKNMSYATSSTTALGMHECPDGSFISPLYGFYNWQGTGWSATGLEQGGYGYNTLVHEIGQALGLAHPFGGGSRPDATSFPGVASAFGSYGQYGLNQTIWTVMSYNDGWKELPSPDPYYSDGYGNVATPTSPRN